MKTVIVLIVWCAFIVRLCEAMAHTVNGDVYKGMDCLTNVGVMWLVMKRLEDEI